MTSLQASTDSQPAQGWLLLHCRQQLLCCGLDPFLPACELPPLPGLLACQPLGDHLGQPLHVCELEQPIAELLGDAHWLSLRSFLDHPDSGLFARLSQASQLATWRRQHRFCGACGTPLQVVADENAMNCPACQLQVWPRLSPSIIVLIHRGEEILLARSPRFRAGFYSVLAGFVEAGESIEQCVHREVLEEVGLEIGNLRYITSQSWPFPHSLMLGFHAEYVSGEIVPQPEEIEDAGWFHIDALPQLPGTGSISRYLIDLYLAGQRPAVTPQPLR